MIGIHKIGRILPSNLMRLNSKVGADTMAYEIAALFARKGVAYKIINNFEDAVIEEFETFLVISGVSSVTTQEYKDILEKLKSKSNIIYLIDDPKLTNELLVTLSDIVLEPSEAVSTYDNGKIFPPELWAASYSYSMVSPEKPRQIRLIYWGSDTGPQKSRRLNKYFPFHSVTTQDDLLYLKSNKYGFDTRVDIDILEEYRSKAKYTICINDKLLSDRTYYNGRIYEAIVSGIQPVADSKYDVYDLELYVPVVKNRAQLEKLMEFTSVDERIQNVKELQMTYSKYVVRAEQNFLEVVR